MRVLNDNFNISNFFENIGKGALLILDYDGTLAPFVKMRMEAYLYPYVEQRLMVLMGLKNTRVVVVSGRGLSNLEILLKIFPSLELWGSHGFERKLPNGEKFYGEIDPKQREGIEIGKRAGQDKISLKFFEIKPYGVALHWRGIASEEKLSLINLIEPIWEKIVTEYDLEIHRFDGGLELRPKGQNKGDVFKSLLAEMSAKTSIAYLGDDLTDEEAFAAIGNRGLKVLVRERFRPTLADIHLIPPEELIVFFDRWISCCREVINE
jgi:trehalose 6-phosphate phosphatase